MAEWNNRIVGHGEEAPDRLLANPKNWRVHPKSQQKALLGVLQQVGPVDEIIVNRRTGFVVNGHLRLELAISEKQATVPVSYVDLSEEEEALVLATFDPISALADQDKERLEALLKEVPPADEATQKMLAKLADDAGIVRAPTEPLDDPGPQVERADELQAKWGTALGQLWLINSQRAPRQTHRLICGDCTDIETVKRLMDGQRATLFATDPPYLVDYDGTNHPHKWNEPDGNKDWSGTYHDWDNSEQGEALYDGFLKVAKEAAITDNAAWYCWHASRNQAMLEALWQKYGAFVHQQIVWVKDRPVLTRSWYMWQHEPCFFGWQKGRKPARMAQDYPPTVWQLPTIKPGVSTDHPTTKPVELFALPMRQHTAPGDVCYEPFAGSGSQIVAAEQEGRICYALELAPAFVAVILERLAGVGLQPRLADA